MPDVLDLLDEPGQCLIITPGFGETDRDARFELACEMYPDARFEMDEAGNIIVTPGNSEDSGYRSGEAFAQLSIWSRQDGRGRAFDASTTFNLPSGAKRSPDAVWVPRETLRREGKNTKTITKTRHVPTFLIDVTSPSDTLREQQEKCRNWIAAGVSEAILLHSETKPGYVFLPSGDVIDYPDATEIAATVLQGFVIDCAPIWEAL